MSYDIGSIVEGTVVDIVKFGAFVKIRGGKTGLIHISQISDKFVKEVSDFVTIGTHVVAKIISVDDKGRIQLSLKNISPEEAAAFLSEPAEDSEKHLPDQEEPRKSAPPREPRKYSDQAPEEDTFEKKLKRFMRQSEDRQVDIKRNLEAKRGIKRRKR